MRARGYTPRECIAVGDSAEDIGVAPLVNRFFLVANAREGLGGENVERTESAYGEGFYEAVVQSLVVESDR
jgi:hydroxymethylpyrimidine pyrophosphatase-like HAD family hydrolase